MPVGSSIGNEPWPTLAVECRPSQCNLTHLVVAVAQMTTAQQAHADGDAEDLPCSLVHDALDPLGEALPLAVVVQDERGGSDLRDG